MTDRDLRESDSKSNVSSRIVIQPVVTLYEDDAGRQVPCYRYLPIPEGVLGIKISSKAKVALGLLYRWADREGRVRGRSQARMGVCMGVSARAFRRHLDALVRSGFVYRTPTSDPETPDAYQVNLLHPLMRTHVVHIPAALVDKISAGAALMMGLLAWRSGTKGWTRQTRAVLADSLGLSPRPTVTLLRELEAEGLVRREVCPGSTPRFLMVDRPWIRESLIRGRAVSAPGGAVSAPPRAVSAPPRAVTAPLVESPSESLKDSLKDSRSREKPRVRSIDPNAGGARAYIERMEATWRRYLPEEIRDESWDARERSIVSKLIEKHGEGEVDRRLRHHVKTWSKRRLRYDDADVSPPMRMLSTLWRRLGEELVDGLHEGKRRRRTMTYNKAADLHGSEWDPAAEDEEPTYGW